MSQHSPIRSQIGSFLGLLLLGLALPSAAAVIEAPATQDGAAVYYGELALRSLADGYVLSIEGEWGSRTFFFRSEGPVEPLTFLEVAAKVIQRERELLVSLPAAQTLIRLAVPEQERGLEVAAEFQSLSPEAQGKLLSKYEAAVLVENVDGYELAVHGRMPAGLDIRSLAPYSDAELRSAVDVARGFSKGEALENRAAPYLNQTPPDPPGSGAPACTSGGTGSSACSKSCSGGDSCSVTCRQGTYSCCYCWYGSAYCTCRTE